MKKLLLKICVTGTALLLLGNISAQSLDHPADTMNVPVDYKYAIPVRTIEIPSVFYSSISVDGFGDEECYSDIQTTHLFTDDGYEGEADFKCEFQVAWSSSYIYFYVEITDDIAHEAADGDNTWEFDNWEIFIDVDTSWTESQWTNGVDPDPETIDQYRINRGALGVSDGGEDPDNWLYVEGTNGSSGWSVECAMPWTAVSTLANLPDNLWEKAIGFDVSAADSDGSDPGPAGARDAQVSWDTEKADNPDNAWYHRNVFGLVTLHSLWDPCGRIGINGVKSESTLLFPNPATETINISLNGLTTLRIYNTTGIELMVVESTGTVDVSLLGSGLYFISDGIRTLSFVVK